MHGHSSGEAVLQQVLWPDAELLAVSIDYAAVVIKIRESTGKVRSVRCEGYIGYSLAGFWDEVVVDRAKVVDSTDFAERCVNDISKRFGRDWPSTGNEQRNTRTWRVLVIQFSDGAQMEVVAASLQVE